MTKKPKSRKIVGQLMYETASAVDTPPKNHHAYGTQQGDPRAVEFQSGNMPKRDPDVRQHEDDQNGELVMEVRRHRSAT